MLVCQVSDIITHVVTLPRLGAGKVWDAHHISLAALELEIFTTTSPVLVVNIIIINVCLQRVEEKNSFDFICMYRQTQ